MSIEETPLTPAEAKRIIQSIPRSAYSETDFYVVITSKDEGIRSAILTLGIPEKEVGGYQNHDSESGLVHTDGDGSIHYVGGEDSLKILAEAGANLSNRQQFLTGRYPS